MSATLHGSAPEKYKTIATLHGNARGPQGARQNDPLQTCQTVYFKHFLTFLAPEVCAPKNGPAPVCTNELPRHLQKIRNFLIDSEVFVLLRPLTVRPSF